jgi:hypothetical protein
MEQNDDSTPWLVCLFSSKIIEFPSYGIITLKYQFRGWRYGSSGRAAT